MKEILMEFIEWHNEHAIDMFDLLDAPEEVIDEYIEYKAKEQ